jgi:hypothetical protein
MRKRAANRASFPEVKDKAFPSQPPVQRDEMLMDRGINHISKSIAPLHNLRSNLTFCVQLVNSAIRRSVQKFVPQMKLKENGTPRRQSQRP